MLDAPVAALSVKMRVGGGGRHCPHWGPGGDKPPPAARRAQLVGLSRPRSDLSEPHCELVIQAGPGAGSLGSLQEGRFRKNKAGMEFGLQDL